MKKIHHDIEFTVLRKKLKNAGSIEDKILLLEQLISLQPRNPKNLALRRKYREEMETLRLKKSSKKSVMVSPYDGIYYKRQVVITGETNTGKSTLLNRLTDADVAVKDTPYTTYKPEVQMMICKGVSIQVVEVPALFNGDTDAAKYRFIRNADVICLCVKSRDDCDPAVEQLMKYSIMLVNEPMSAEKKQQKTGTEIVEKPAVVASWNPNLKVNNLTVLDINDKDSISERIFRLFNIKRIFLRLHGEIQEHPRVFPAEQEVTVHDFIKSLDKRLAKRFKRAKITHNDPSMPDVQSAGLEFVLKDGDIVEIISF
ncbi:MAG: 50S ribosome-binding GTPase [Dehalococcoidales bacterium]|nr:MAG: 50S ribosome-binding GTPase [Dehalococcoidales bacterium]